jgi:hypothetical protein
MRSLLKTSLWLLALVVAVAVTAIVAIQSTRPAPPDPSNDETWILVKKDVQSDTEVRVYVVEHRSTTWDPHDLAQNKIVVTSRTVERQFNWPSDQNFAGGWCEVIHGRDGSIAIILFGSEKVVRVVAFINGRFVFRPQNDELVSDGALTYTAGQLGELVFEVREADRRGAWQWTPRTGFRKLTQPE